MNLEPKAAIVIGQQTMEIELLRSRVQQLEAENAQLKEKLQPKTVESEGAD